MNQYQRRILARHGYSAKKPCSAADVCPSLSLTNLFGATPAQRPSDVRRLLQQLPRNFEEAVISPERETGTIAFLVRAMPLSRQRDLIDDMRAQLDPPKGVSAELAGPPVLAAEARSDMQSSRRLIALGGVMAVLAVLLMSLGSFRAALGPLLPVAAATGWAGLIAYLSGVPLNALSAVLPVVVLAVTAGLALVVSDRYRRDRASGLASEAALARAYGLVRRPLLACAVVATAGFAALVPNDFRMLRDFGIVGLADLLIVLAASALVLPAALVWVEQISPLRLPRITPPVARRARRES
jgi:predicted RND superfamily exporter protein